MSIIAWLIFGVLAGFVGIKLQGGMSRRVLLDILFGGIAAVLGGSFLLGFWGAAPL